MRIHSKHKDYYDSALGYGIDPNCHYVRKEDEFKAPSGPSRLGERSEYNDIEKMEFLETFLKTKPTQTRYRDDSSRIETALTHGFLFCGKMYVCIEFTTGAGKTLWAYSADDVLSIIKIYGSKLELANWNGKKIDKWSSSSREFGGPYFRYGIYNKEHMKKFFEIYQAVERKEFMDYHHDIGIPVMMFTNQVLVYNPVLADYKFYKIVDAFQAFQELSMFISGVLGGNSPKMVEISDKIRIAKHGFNEMSFRKEKELKKS